MYGSMLHFPTNICTPLAPAAGKKQQPENGSAPRRKSSALGWFALLLGGFCLVVCGATPLRAATSGKSDLGLSASSEAFGNVLINTSSPNKTLILTSTGTAAVTINSVKLSGAPAFHMSTGSFPVTLSPNHSLAVRITFAPTGGGAKTGTLTIASNAQNGATQTVALSGTSLVPQLGLSVSTLSFGQLLLHSAAVQKTVTLTSSGTGPLTITSVKMSGDGVFTLAGIKLPMTLAAGQTTQLSVGFNPLGAGTKTGTITLASNSYPDGAATVDLTGEVLAPGLKLGADSVSFGTVGIGLQATPRTVTLLSSGTAPLIISSAILRGAPAFSMSGQSFPVTLNPGQKASVTINFHPESEGSKGATLTLTSNAAAASTATVTLTGNSVAEPALKLSTSTVSFGSVAEGTAATPKTVTITSSGTVPLTISAGKIMGATAFSMTGVSFPLTLNPGATATLTIGFDPQLTGEKSGTIELTSNAGGGSTSSIALSGTSFSRKLTLSSGSLAFGNVLINTNASPQILTLTSSGTAAVTVDSGTLSGAAAFTMSGLKFPITLSPGQSAKLTVKFDPPAAGSAAATITLNSNAGSESSAAVGLTGKGVVAGLTVSTGSVNFGEVAAGIAATPLKVTLTSSGTGPLTIESGSLAGGAAFAMSGAAFPLTLSPGQKTALTVTFDPASTGQKSGTITLTTNASAGATTTIALSGDSVAAPAITVSKASLTFGTVAVDTAATPQLITLTSVGKTPLTVSSATLSGAGSAAFQLSGASFPLTLNPTQRATLTVNFAPTAAGAKSGTLTLASNALSGSSTNVALSGTAVAPVLTLSTTSIAFGNEALDTSATARTVTITSSGTVPLTLDKISLAGGGAFSMSAGTFPMTLSPGSTTTVTVGFDPSSAGAKSGTLQLTSNASPETVSINLSGTGVAPGILSGLSCGSGSMTGAGTDTCTLSMTSAAGSGGMMVALSSSDQAVAVPASVTIPAGSSSATFSATVSSVTTSQTATLKATAGAVTESYPILLNAATPALTLGSATLSFGDVTVNSAVTQDETLTSSGTASLTISADSVTGTGFSIGGLSLPVTLNPGQQATLEIQFDPTTTGGTSGTVSLTTNTSGGSVAIGLSGTGTAASYQVDLSWDAPSSSNPAVVGYYIFRTVSGSSNYQQLNPTAEPSTTYQDTSVQGGTTYIYYVESVDSEGNTSAPSGTFSVTVP